MMKYKVIDTGISSAKKNMEVDTLLLNNLANMTEPILHFYGWRENSATYGHFIQPENYLCVASVHEFGLELAKRPTGGGIIFHLTDFAFSILIPATYPNYSTNSLENYSFINTIVMKAVNNFLGLPIPISLLQSGSENRLRFCMAEPTIYDVMVGDKKIGGAAQRRTKYGYLHQGSVLLAMPPYPMIEKMLLNSDHLVKAMRESSYSLVDRELLQEELLKVRSDFRDALVDSFTQLI